MIKQINDWLAVKCTLMMSNMWAAYIFLIISMISLPAAIASHDPFIIVSWISQSFLQLVLLPVILIGGSLLSQSSEARAEQDHLAVMEIVKDIHEMMIEETDEGTDLKDILARLTVIEQTLTKSSNPL